MSAKNFEWVYRPLSPEVQARLEAERKERVEHEEWQKERRIADVMRAWGIPRRVLSTLGHSSPWKPLQRTQAWVARDPASWCLVLSADKGAGKSTAAGWWLWSAAQRDVVSTYPHWPRQCWWDSGALVEIKNWDERLGQICFEPRLVIDDLGVEDADPRGTFQAKLERIVDSRYREYLPTIITTNLVSAAFAERYGERIMRRLREGGVWESIAGSRCRETE